MKQQQKRERMKKRIEKGKDKKIATIKFDLNCIVLHNFMKNKDRDCESERETHNEKERAREGGK